MPHLLLPPQVEVEAGSLFSNEYQDCYFQTSAPIDEIHHVFINGNQLTQLWDECHSRGQSIVIIGETGFGTGLNFIVTWALWREWRQQNSDACLKLHFVSVEFAPLTKSDLEHVYTAFPQYKDLVSQLLAAWPPSWQGCHYRQLPDGVTLSLLFGDGVDMLSEHHFLADCWFLDGFAPSRNHRMWSSELYTQLALHSKPNTRLATFTAAGHVRRGLEEVGFKVERLAGFNKRHMSVARFKPQDAAGNNASEMMNAKKKRVAIIGAGYAGLHLAANLNDSNLSVDLFDQSEPMSGASGNYAHLLYLKPRRKQNEFNHFFEQAYGFAVAHYQQNSSDAVLHTGCLHLIDPRDHWDQTSLAEVWPENWVELVSADKAAALSGIPFQQSCLWMPKACIIRPEYWAAETLKQLTHVQLFAHHKLIQCHYDHAWHLEFESAESKSIKTSQYDYVIWAAGAGNIELLLQHGNKCLGPHPEKPSHWRYPLRPIAGQSSLLDIKQAKQHWPCSSLKTALSGSVYITPDIDGLQSLGSRFYPDQFAGEVCQEDHAANIKDLCDGLDQSLDVEDITPFIVEGTSATRVQSSDYLPMVGEIFKEQGPGLFILSGFGAKGTITAPFTAQILANILNPGAPIASDHIIKMLNPDRFAQRLERFAPKPPRPRSWKNT